MKYRKVWKSVQQFNAHIIEKCFYKGIWDLFPRDIEADFYHLAKGKRLQVYNSVESRERKKEKKITRDCDVQIT